MITIKQIDDETVWNTDTQEWEPPICQATHPIYDISCSRARGHRGPHVALADEFTMLEQWPNER